MAYKNTTGLSSVTDILSPYIEKRWFDGECMERGTAVHAACETHLKGLYAPKLLPAWQLYVDSFRRWSDIAINSVELSETRLKNNSLRYCGKPDAILSLRDNPEILVLVDWKTSQATQNWWQLQIVAYRKLAEHNGIKTERGLSVRLKNNGAVAIADEYTSMSDWNVFIGLLNSYRFFYGEKNGFRNIE